MKQRYIFGLCALLTLAGCVDDSPANHYYLLTPVTAGKTQTSPVTLAQVILPAYLDRPQIVRRNRSQLSFSEFERWGESLDSMTRRVLAADLAATPATGAPRAVKVTIDDFTSDEDGNVHLQAHWLFSGKSVSHSFTKTAQSADSSNAALAITMSDLLGRLATTIAQSD